MIILQQAGHGGHKWRGPKGRVSGFDRVGEIGGEREFHKKCT